MSDDLFDVLAVKIATGEKRLIAESRTELDAQAVIRMAVTRRGVENEFFRMRPHGLFQGAQQ